MPILDFNDPNPAFGGGGGGGGGAEDIFELVMDTSMGSGMLTLDPAASYSVGDILIISSSDAPGGGFIFLEFGDNIDGEMMFPLGPSEVLTLRVADGTTFNVLGSSPSLSAVMFATGGDTVTLPSFAVWPQGTCYLVVFNWGSGVVTVEPNGGDSITGGNQTIDTLYQGMVFRRDSSAWEPYTQTAGLGGGGGTGHATHASTAVIGASAFAELVTFTNSGADPVLLGLSLSGADASGVRIYPGSAYSSDIGLAFAEATASINALLVPGSGSSTVWVARASGITTAITDCTIAVTQPDEDDTTIDVTGAALATLLEYATTAGFTTWWSFPSSGNLEDQIGTADLTGTGSRGAAEIRGAGGTWTPSGGGTRTGGESPGRDDDGCLLLIWEQTAVVAYPDGWAALGSAYDDPLQFCQVNAIGGSGAPDNDPGDAYDSYALRVQGPASGGWWVDTGGLVVPELSTLSTTPGYTRRVVALAVNFNHSTGCYSYLFGGDGRPLTSVTSATAVGTEASAPTAFALFTVYGGSLASAKYHAAGFIKGAKMTEAQFVRMLALANIPT